MNIEAINSEWQILGGVAAILWNREGSMELVGFAEQFGVGGEGCALGVAHVEAQFAARALSAKRQRSQGNGGNERDKNWIMAKPMAHFSCGALVWRLAMRLRLPDGMRSERRLMCGVADLTANYACIPTPGDNFTLARRARRSTAGKYKERLKGNNEMAIGLQSRSLS